MISTSFYPGVSKALRVNQGDKAHMIFRVIQGDKAHRVIREYKAFKVFRVWLVEVPPSLKLV